MTETTRSRRFGANDAKQPTGGFFCNQRGHEFRSARKTASLYAGVPPVLVAQSLYRPYIVAASMENRNEHPAPERKSETPSKHPHIPAMTTSTLSVIRAPKPMPLASATAAGLSMT